MLILRDLSRKWCITCQHYRGERHLVPRSSKRNRIEMKGPMCCALNPKMHGFPKEIMEWGVSCINYEKWNELA